MSPLRTARIVAPLSAALVFASSASLAGCGTEVEIAVPRPQTDPGVPAPAPTTSTTKPEDGPPVRLVEDRDPFGRTAEAQNLLVDGDFEITGRASQMPWIAFGANGQQTLSFATGGRCRSGVRCGKLAKGEAMVGFVASPKNGEIKVSLWAQPSGEACKDVEVQLLDLDTNVPLASVALVAEKVDASKWCHFEATAPGFPMKQAVLYVDVSTKAAGDVLIDDASVMPAGPSPKKRGFVAWSRPTPATQQRVAAIAAWVRAHRIYGIRPQPLPESVPPRKRIVDAPR